MNTLLDRSASARTLDVGGLEAPEPMVRILEALDTLGEDERLRVMIDREPVPLYRILLRNGYQYRTTLQDAQRYEVLIWLVPGA
jgi:TusA-related sulfurtransferase